MTTPAVSIRSRTLAAAAAPARMLAAAGLVDTADPDTRTLSGMVLPFGEIGHTNLGPIEVAPTFQLDVPADLDAVALIEEHTDPPQPIGYLEAWRRVPTGYRMAFHVGATPDGDRALLLVAERLRRGFSVELDDMEFGADGRLTRARLIRVAHVTTPAFHSARHDGMAASRTTPMEGTTPMLTEEQRARLSELLGMADRTDEQDTELAELLELAGSQLPGTEDPPAEDPPAEDPPAEDPPTERLAAGRGSARRGASVPGNLGGGGRRRSTPELRQLYAATARVLSGRSRPELEAALAPITNSANLWTGADEYAGQLWSGLEYVRRWVANSTPAELRSYKGTGWRWVVKPAVGDYAGDKTAVPSNAPTTEDAAWTAARLAGAHDIDRKFWDFGDTEFIEAYYAAMRESYAAQSDGKALAFQLASATALGGVAETSLFRAAAVAAQAVEDNTLGASVDFIYVNSADRLALLDMTESQVPAYLETFGVTPDKFVAAPGVVAGTVVAGSKRATRFRELAGSPIRVEAINLANGGVDGGVFGYYATELVMPGGIASQTFA